MCASAEAHGVSSDIDGKQKYFIGVVLDISRKASVAQVFEETVVSRCFAGCLVQARNCCSNRCLDLRDYASDVRPTDALAASVESPKSGASSRSCVLLCRSKLKEENLK